MMVGRKLMLSMLCITVIAPIVLYTDRLSIFIVSSEGEFMEDVTTPIFSGLSEHLSMLPLESSTHENPIGIINLDDKSFSESDALARQKSSSIESSTNEMQAFEEIEHKSTRMLSMMNEEEHSQGENPIKLVTNKHGDENASATSWNPKTTGDESKLDSVDSDDNLRKASTKENEQQSAKTSVKVDQSTSGTPAKISVKVDQSGSRTRKDQLFVPDARVRQLRDQLIRAKVYLSLPATRNNPHFTRELRLKIKEVQRALWDAIKDSDLPRNANEKMKSMEQTLAKGKQIHDDCSVEIKKLRAMLHSEEEQLRVHRKQTMFLTQLTAKTLPKGLHCLSLRLTTEYYNLNPSQQLFPNQQKLEDPSLYHYALFSDNVLAAAVVVNSTITHAKEPSKHVFHIVTDRLNYAAMRMWFLSNPPGHATLQVQNIEDFTWLNSSYSPVLKQLGSPSMIDYYFKAHRANFDSNMKFRNPKYLSILNHLRFYLPEIFPKLNKVLFLDDDIVVQKELSDLFSIDLKQNVNGAVETCGESFHRFDRYLNFSNPLISKNFDPNACGWAYGMNIFDLNEWKRQDVTEVYHNWQKLNHDRQLWKLGTLPPGLITFWKRTYPIDRSWHVLGLGYNPNISQREIGRAAVIHYNGNMKPWLEIGIPKYRSYWGKYANYDQVYLRECNINP